MADDVDDLLRRAMKTLDDGVPSGYFEDLPKRTLSRLEGTMQSTGQSTAGTSSDQSQISSMGAQSVTAERDEDSGLHDIRNLASSAKLRLSSRRSTQNPVVVDDDVLASSSAGWKAVALPEPAKMVSLPELANLPTKAELDAADKAARAKAKKAEAKAAPAAAAVAVEAEAAPAVDLPEVASIGSRITAQRSSGRGKTFALVGFGLAAAAGAAVFVATQNKSDSQDTAGQVASEPRPVATVERTAKLLPPPPPPAADDGLAAAGVAVEPIEPVADAVVEEPAAAPARKDKPKVHKVEIRDTVNKADKPDPKPEPEVKKVEPKGEGDGEPSFDELLKEAGVGEKKVVKPKLDKKALSGSDIKNGMSSVAGKAQGCFSGTQGTASVKLTVDPSGKVQKVKVTGVFAGTPVAACVSAAVKSATFPPWDGGPQTFGYSYLLQAE